MQTLSEQAAAALEAYDTVRRTIRTRYPDLNEEFDTLDWQAIGYLFDLLRAARDNPQT
jgi:hypothetical protein